MIASIFVIPLVYFINAFLIGRLIKRFNISINPFFACIVGFIAFFDAIYFITIWMYAGKVTIWSYFVVIGILQCILLALYIANWRYIFITWSVDYKKIVAFAITFCLTILIGWLNFRQYNSEFGKNWIWIIDNPQTSIWQNMWFGTTEDDIISNFSAFNVMNIFWLSAFNINIRDNALLVCNWSWTIIAAGFVACLATWMISKNTSKPRIAISLIIVLVLVVLTLAFIESYAIGDAWILLFLFVYILAIIKPKESHPLRLFVLTTVLIGFLAASCTSFFTVICVWIFSMYYAIRNRQNTLNYLLFLSWPLMLTIFSLLSIYSYWLLSLMDALYLTVVIIFLFVFRKVGTPSWDTKISLSIYHHSGKIIYAGLIILIALILISNFFIFQEIYDWKASNIDYKNFLTFTYTYIWSLNITSGLWIAIFNALMYTLFAALAIAYVAIRRSKNNKFKPLLKDDSAIKFGVISCVLFINPLVIHMLKISTEKFPLNTLDLNMLFVIPIFVLALKATFNYKLVPIQMWKYSWY